MALRSAAMPIRHLRPTGRAAAAALAAGALFLAACGGSSSAHTSSSTVAAGEPNLVPLLLTRSDLPSGWSKSNSKSGGASGARGCPAFDTVSNIRDSDSVVFAQSGQSGLPQLAEALGYSNDAPGVFAAGTSEFGSCKHVSFKTSAGYVPATVQTITFPEVGDQSAAYQLAIDVEGVPIDFDIVVARKGSYISLLALGALGQPNLLELGSFESAALAKLPSSS
jgi:hypothetical protein